MATQLPSSIRWNMATTLTPSHTITVGSSRGRLADLVVQVKPVGQVMRGRIRATGGAPNAPQIAVQVLGWPTLRGGQEKRSMKRAGVEGRRVGSPRFGLISWIQQCASLIGRSTVDLRSRPGDFYTEGMKIAWIDRTTQLVHASPPRRAYRNGNRRFRS